MPDIKSDDNMQKAIDLAKSIYTPSPDDVGTQGRILPIRKYDSGRVEFDPSAGVLGGLLEVGKFISGNSDVPVFSYDENGERHINQKAIEKSFDAASQIMLGGVPASYAERAPGVMLGTSGSRTVPEAAEAIKLAKTIRLADIAAANNMTPKELGQTFTKLKKTSTPYEDWSYEIANQKKMLPKPIFDVNQLRLGDVLQGFFGDRSPAGYDITSINGMKLGVPATAEGGSEHALMNVNQETGAPFNRQSVWKSGPSVTSSLVNRGLRGQAVSRWLGYEDPRVLGVHVNMGPHAQDFSTHTSEALLGTLKDHPISEYDLDEFDQFMREKSPHGKAFEDFPGLRSEELRDWLLSPDKGAARLKFSKGMDTDYFRSKNFPEVGPARFATTHPELAAVPTYASGHMINLMDMADPIEKEFTSSNRSYPVDIIGTPLGRLAALPHKDVIFPDFIKGFNENPPIRNQIPAKYKRYLSGNAFQIVTPEYQDYLGNEIEKMLREGREEGGRTMGNNAIDNAIRMARLSDDEIEMPHSLKELQAWKKAHPSHKADMDKTFTSRMSGIEGAEPVAMPADLNELLAYLRSRHSSGGRSHYDDGGDVRGGDSPFMSRADYGLGSASARSQETPSFREAEDRSMRDYNRAVESGWSPTGGGGGGWGSSVPSVPSEGMMGRGLPEGTPTTDVNPFAFGRSYSAGIIPQAGVIPSNLSEWTKLRMGYVPETIEEAAKDPSYFFGIGMPSLVGVQPTRAGMAGYIGNLAAESEMNPAVINKRGNLGLAQWGDSRRDALLDFLGIDASLNRQELQNALAGTGVRQFGFGLNEMASDPYYAPSFRQLTEGTSPETAATVMMKNFEAPSKEEQAQSLGRRASGAQSYYKTSYLPTESDAIRAALYSGADAAAKQTGLKQEAMLASPTVKLVGDAEEVIEQPKSLAEIPLLLNASLTPALNRARIAELESQGMTELGREYELTDAEGNVISPKEWYRQDMQRQLNRPVSIDEVKSGIVTRDGQQVVNYALKDPETEILKAIMPGAGGLALLQKLFGGEKSGDQQVAEAVAAAREGGGGDRGQQQAMALPAAAPQAAPAPYLTELSPGSLALKSKGGLTPEQFAALYTGGDMSKVHARVVYVNGAPQVEYYSPESQTAVA